MLPQRQLGAYAGQLTQGVDKSAGYAKVSQLQSVNLQRSPTVVVTASRIRDLHKTHVL